MAMFQKCSCSGSLTATIVSLFLLITIVHMFFFPFIPSSLDYIGFRQIQRQCTPNSASVMGKLSETFDSNSFDRFPVDAVSYRNAPWKANIGKWLSGCDPLTEVIEINEVSAFLHKLYLSIYAILSCLVVWVYVCYEVIL